MRVVLKVKATNDHLVNSDLWELVLNKVFTLPFAYYVILPQLKLEVDGVDVPLPKAYKI